MHQISQLVERSRAVPHVTHHIIFINRKVIISQKEKNLLRQWIPVTAFTRRHQIRFIFQKKQDVHLWNKLSFVPNILLQPWKPFFLCVCVCFLVSTNEQHSHLPGNCGFPRLPKMRQEQRMSRAVSFMLSSECGWRVTLDSHNMPLWEACVQSPHS